MTYGHLLGVQVGQDIRHEPANTAACVQRRRNQHYPQGRAYLNVRLRVIHSHNFEISQEGIWVASVILAISSRMLNRLLEHRGQFLRNPSSRIGGNVGLPRDPAKPRSNIRIGYLVKDIDQAP